MANVVVHPYQGSHEYCDRCNLPRGNARHQVQSSWDYRLVNVNGEVGLYEVYYHNDVPDSRTEDPITFVGDTADEVTEELQLALASITGRPVLTDDDIGLQQLLAKVADEAEREKDRPVKLHRHKKED